MVKRTRTGTRNTRRVRRKTVRRTARRTNLRSMVVRETYPFKRFVGTKLTFQGNDAVPNQVAATSFAFSDLPNVTEFSALFDRYRLAGIAYRWCIYRDPMYSATGTSATRSYPRLCWVHDYDDANTPGTSADLYQYPKMREFFFTDNHNATRWNFIRPAKAMVGYEGATNSFYSPDWKAWVDMASTTVPHYGIKASVDGLFTGVNITLQTRYYIVCKNVR